MIAHLLNHSDLVNFALADVVGDYFKAAESTTMRKMNLYTCAEDFSEAGT